MLKAPGAYSPPSSPLNRRQKHHRHSPRTRNQSAVAVQLCAPLPPKVKVKRIPANAHLLSGKILRGKLEKVRLLAGGVKPERPTQSETPARMFRHKPLNLLLKAFRSAVRMTRFKKHGFRSIQQGFKSRDQLVAMVFGHLRRGFRSLRIDSRRVITAKASSLPPGDWTIYAARR